LVGTIEKIDFKLHSFGEQYTTIDGQEYVTHINLSDPACAGIRTLAVVEFEVAPEPKVLCNHSLVEVDLPSATQVRRMLQRD
jgi:hypothetical protein